MLFSWSTYSFEWKSIYFLRHGNSATRAIQLLATSWLSITWKLSGLLMPSMSHMIFYQSIQIIRKLKKKSWKKLEITSKNNLSCKDLNYYLTKIMKSWTSNIFCEINQLLIWICFGIFCCFTWKKKFNSWNCCWRKWYFIVKLRNYIALDEKKIQIESTKKSVPVGIYNSFTRSIRFSFFQWK